MQTTSTCQHTCKAWAAKEALSVHAADASSWTCWFGPAWLAHGMQGAFRKSGVVAFQELFALVPSAFTVRFL